MPIILDKTNLINWTETVNALQGQVKDQIAAFGGDVATFGAPEVVVLNQLTAFDAALTGFSAFLVSQNV